MEAIIYKLTIGQYWYVGSTTMSLSQRLGYHHNEAKIAPTRKLYKTIVENGGWGIVVSEILRSLPYTTGEDLRKEETNYIQLDDLFCLNTLRAFVSEEERKQLDRDNSARKYAQNKQNPEWKERTLERQRELYSRQRENPEFLQKRRESALASYHRRKNKKESPQKESLL